jgi:hypothetical protein
MGRIIIPNVERTIIGAPTAGIALVGIEGILSENGRFIFIYCKALVLIEREITPMTLIG